MTRLRLCFLVLALPAAACSDPVHTGPRVGEVCDTEGPVRLYAPVVSAPGQGFAVIDVQRAGERWLIGLADRPEPFGETAPEDKYDWFNHRIVSVDECGGDSRDVLHGSSRFSRAPDGTWFSYGDDILTVFDPSGDSTPEAFEDFVGCPFPGTDGQLFASRIRDDEDSRDIFAVTFEEGRPVATLLDERVKSWDLGMSEGQPPQIVTLNAQGELAKVDTRTGHREIRNVGVVGLVVGLSWSTSPRFVAFSADTEDDIFSGESGTWFSWDRLTNEQRRIGDVGGGEVHVWRIDRGLQARQRTGGDDVHHFIDAGAPEGLTVAATESVSAPRPDGHRLIRPRRGGGPLELMAPDQTRRVLVDLPDDGELWVDGEDFLLSVRLDGHSRHAQSIWRLSPDDDLPRLALAYGVAPVSLGDRLWATVLDPTERSSGDLVVVSEDAPAPLLIDHDVEYALRPNNGLGADPSFPPPMTDGPLLYTVQDPTGERSGIWMVRIER